MKLHPSLTVTEQEMELRLRALADPARRRILRALALPTANSLGKPQGLCAGDVERHVALSQPTVSHHLAILRRAGLVEAKKIGQWVWYQRKNSALQQLATAVRKDI